MATVIYDFETTGLNPYHEDVIEIGAKLVGSDVSFTCLVRPYSGNPVSDKITSITGISNDMIMKEGLPSQEAYTQFLNFLNEIYSQYQSLTLVAHNGQGFDDIFLKKMIRILQSEGQFDYGILLTKLCFVDSLGLCRYLHPQRYSHSMKSMCQMYNIQNLSAHRAMGDVNALCEIWTHLMNHIQQKHGDTSGPYLRYLTYC